LVVGDGVHVGVVLGEVAGWVAQVPKEVGADGVTTKAPGVTLGMTFEHSHCAAADFVDVFDLPRCVMKERHRGGLDQQVVMVGGAAHEGGDTGDLVAYLESDPIDEEALRGFGVGSADDDVAELAGTDRSIAPDCCCAIVCSFDPTRPVVARDHRWILGDPRGDLDHHPGAAVDLNCADAGVVALGGDPESGQSVGYNVQVVGIVDTDEQLDQPAAGALDDAQLLAAIAGREKGTVAGQPELGVVASCLIDVGNADRDRCQSVESHRHSPQLDVRRHGFVRVPMPSIVVVITSPSPRNWRLAAPTPSGVPVKIRSPRLRLRMLDR